MEAIAATTKREIRAAGAVLWRRNPDGELSVAVVHRPRYDDWSLPKGKLEHGETVPSAAVREIKEETGFGCVLGRFLSTISYQVDLRGDPVPKTVGYFSARALDGSFTPDPEVDELKWLPPAKAHQVLTYAQEVEVLEEFAAVTMPLTSVLLVRHGKAGKRENWNGDDDLRPLSEAGARQAAALRAMLPLFGADRVHSAPRLRCVQTVRGIAEDLGTDILHEPLLSEEGYWHDPVRGMARLLAIVSAGGTPLICSQGAVIPDLVGTLAQRDGVPIAKVPAKKGSLWLLSFATPPDGPRLIAAKYLPTALPAPD